MSVFSKRLTTIMKLKKMTQAELATKAHIKRQTISQYIKGKTYPNAEVLGNIAAALNVSADYLLGLTDVISSSSDVRSICDYTGLSDYAVNFLHNYLVSNDIAKDSDLNPEENDYSNQYPNRICNPRDLINDLFGNYSNEMIYALDEICQGLNIITTPVWLLSKDQKEDILSEKSSKIFAVMSPKDYQETMIAKGTHRILRTLQAICFKYQNPIFAEVLKHAKKD